MLLDLIQLIKKYGVKVDAVIQPGAHYGQEQALYDQLGIPDENRYYFEPQKAVFEVLKQNVGGRGTLYNFALGNQNGEFEMHVSDDNQGMSNSLLEPDLHVTQYPHIVFNKKEKVSVFRFDDIFPANKLNKNWLLNLDTQGSELQVLQGMQKILPYVQCIVCEVNRASVYKGAPMVEEIDEFLAQFGFERKEVSWDGGTWGDAFYCR